MHKRCPYKFLHLFWTVCFLTFGCGGSTEDNPGGGSSFDFQGGQVDLKTMTFNSVDLSDDCNATADTEQFLINLLTWAARPISEGGVGLLESIYVPGYPSLAAGAVDNLEIRIEIPSVTPIVISVPMIRQGNDIVVQGEAYLEEEIDTVIFGIFPISCALTSYASGIITPTSNTMLVADINMRELTLSGSDCPVDFQPGPGCEMLFNIEGTIK